jgi:hypothetical protein
MSGLVRISLVNDRGAKGQGLLSHIEDTGYLMY